MENVYEQIFFLKHYDHWSFAEVYSLPIGLRNWFVKRTLKQMEDQNKATEAAHKKARRK